MDISPTASPRLPVTAPAPSRGTDTDPQSQGSADATTSATAETRQQAVELRAVIKELATRDREVRAHEAAHKAAAGSLAHGAASFVYQTGPDHRRYAVGGEVGIDISPVVGNPEATLRKAETVRAAALAPAKPSSQDLAVAAQAAQMAARARQEIREQGAQQGNDATTHYAQTAAAGARTETGNNLNLVI